MGLEASDELLIRRVVTQAGRNRVYINGSLSTVADLVRLTSQLFDICGQNEHQALSDRSVQRQILDAFASGTRYLPQLAENYQRIKAVSEELSQHRMDDNARQQRIADLKRHLAEIESAQLKSGEEEALSTQVSRLRRASELKEATVGGERLLYSGDDAILDQLTRLERDLGALQSADTALKPIADQIREARILLEDCGSSLGRYAQGLDLDTAPARAD